MTVVSPSAISTVVTARCVSIDGIGCAGVRLRVVRRRLLDEDAHDHGVRRGDLRRHAQRQRRVLELHRDGVVRHHLNRNLRALRDFRFDVVLRRHARRRQDAALAVALERAQADVEVQRAVDRAEREADGRRVGAGRRRRCRPSGRRCSGTPGRCWCRAPGSTRPLKPHWMPRSRALLRLSCTMRASISTCGCGRSSVATSSAAAVSRSAGRG